MSIETTGQHLLAKFEALFMDTKKSLSPEDFISQASHQVKTPLTALKLQVEMAKKVLEDENKLTPAQMKNIINRTHQDIVRLGRLLDDMVDVSRINIGKFEMHMEYFNVHDFIESLCQKAQKEIQGFRDSKITLNAPVMAKWDKKKMEQALLSLLSNGLNFGDPQSIEFTTFSGGGYVYLKVHDKKTVLPKSILGKFQKVLQTLEPEEKDSRFLGLFIALKIVKMHKGVISMGSAEDHGTFCELQIPLRP